MKTNFNEIFESMVDELKESEGFSIDAVLDVVMPQIIFRQKVTKADMAREIIRTRLTSALNNKDIYSFSKGHFVWIENANEEQLKHFREKAERDVRAAAKRQRKAERFLDQISMAWDSNGTFIGFHVPKAVNE